MPNDDRNAVVEPFESTTFCITVTDEIGCQKTECVFVPVLLPFTGAPNAFSPNGDNLNDIFQVLPEPQLKQTALKIYNRWGDLLYESQDFFEWNGSVSSKKQSVDTYIWVAEFEHRNTGEISVQEGYITLIR
jgi:gliding motility-associated-like protein